MIFVTHFAFANHDNFTVSTKTFPSGLKYIGHHAFFNCKRINITGKLPDALTYIGNDAFTYQNTDGKIVKIEGVNFTAFVSGNIPHNMIWIGDNAFAEHTNFEIANDINILPELTYIGNKSFYNCTRIKNQIISINSFPKLSFIGENAFYKSIKLRGPLTLETINKIKKTNAMFANCTVRQIWDNIEKNVLLERDITYEFQVDYKINTNGKINEVRAIIPSYNNTLIYTMNSNNIWYVFIQNYVIDIARNGPVFIKNLNAAKIMQNSNISSIYSIPEKRKLPVELL